MRNLKIFSVATLALVTVLAFAQFAIACDGDKTAAATADAKAACSSKTDAAVAGAKAACSSKTDAAVAGAKAACSSKTDAAVAGAAGCSAKTDAAVAGAGCSAKTGAASVALETVRMPSGALAVFYNGADAATVEHLQTAAALKGASFGCNLAGDMASNENCNIEVANTETGIMLLVTSDQADLLDGFQKDYDVAVANMTKGAESTKSSDEQGE